MKYKAVIFDFNGTLYWDTSHHNQAWDIFLNNHHLSLSNEEKAAKIHGKSNSDILKAIFERKLSPQEIHQMEMEKELIYHEIALREKLDYAPGALNLFSYLQSIHIPYTIATSSGWVNIEFYIKYMDLAKWFNTEKIIYDNGNFRGKPNPDIFLLAMQKLNTKPEDVLIFEDSLNGIMAAESAGVGKIIVVNSTGGDYSHLPYTIINHFDKVDRNLFEV
jgi:beta-phosphoglucomutase